MQLELGHPVELAGEGHRVGLEPVEHGLPAVAAPPRRRPSSPRHSRPWSSAYLRASDEELPLHLQRGRRRAVGHRQRPGQRAVERHLVHGAAPGRRATRLAARRRRRPRSWPARARWCPPSRRWPPRTGWRRRRSRGGAGSGCGSACGSSRVLTIGRFKRGLEADLLLEELGPLGELEVDRVSVVRRPSRSRPCPPGEDLPGHEVRGDRRRSIRANGTARSIR